MKKGFLLGLAALTAVASSAFADNAKSKGMAVNALRLKGVENVATVKSNIDGKQYVCRQDASFENRMRKAAENDDAMTPIEDPEGEKKLYQRECLSFYTVFGDQTYAYLKDCVLTIPERRLCPDNPISHQPTRGRSQR